MVKSLCKACHLYARTMLIFSVLLKLTNVLSRRIVRTKEIFRAIYTVDLLCTTKLFLPFLCLIHLNGNMFIFIYEHMSILPFKFQYPIAKVKFQ